MKISPGYDEEAIAAIKSKVPVLSRLASADWARVPLALRQKAQFSSRVESARVMSGIQSRLVQMAEQIKSDSGIFMDRRNFVSDLRKIAQEEGLTPWDPFKVGGLQDITSISRLNLIYSMQTQMAEGWARHSADMDPDALDEYPAQELVRDEDREMPRNWPERWKAAGGQFYGGRMIALKTDQIWIEISEFGLPHPPFDFNSGMGLLDVSKKEALALGIIGEGWDAEKASKGAEVMRLDETTASIRGIEPEYLAQLRKEFGAQIKLTGAHMRWSAEVGDSPYLATNFFNKTPEQLRQAKEAIAEIDKIHVFKAVTGAVPINEGVTDPESNGEYTSGNSPKIGIKDGKTDGVGMTVAHEFGHHVDRMLGGGKAFASNDPGATPEIRKALAESQAYDDLKQHAKTMPRTEAKAFEKYWLSDVELFARAYSQWIVEKSANTDMRAELDRRLSGFVGWQWKKDDFKPIAKAFDDYFAKKGVLK